MALDPPDHEPDDELPLGQLILAQSAFYLNEQGQVETASLLLEVDDVEITEEIEFGTRSYVATLNVPGWVYGKFDDEYLIRDIEHAFRLISRRHGANIQSVIVGAALPQVDKSWRDVLYSRLSGDSATNHAARISNPDPRLRREDLTFESMEEIRVYDALKRAQKELTDGNHTTISIFPLPMGRVGIGRVWIPDFLVVREGRAGLIEVDGPHHRGRLAADMTRDREWKNSGFIHIDRILVEDTHSDSDLDRLIRSFLNRLKK
ncbi:hypothetical protein Aph01nite_59080 [Acrocarpospora phusangensis]|uniref:DUF559 domain-containing protein n=1 Tax=Acrocarpospora phusangensis TaxID=1070424 RepID=A0A919QHC6_9ACTN|nr:hypothetical protein [Acrocarpospora phusangensis]GIH27598.1 hypothetical protein Aph01nite_59080 [Acrocarpospora phusangensis]